MLFYITKSLLHWTAEKNPGPLNFQAMCIYLSMAVFKWNKLNLKIIVTSRIPRKVSYCCINKVLRKRLLMENFYLVNSILKHANWFTFICYFYMCNRFEKTNIYFTKINIMNVRTWWRSTIKRKSFVSSQFKPTRIVSVL